MVQMRVSAENPTWDRAYLDSKRLSVWNRRPSPITLFPVGGAIAARACAFSLALLALAVHLVHFDRVDLPKCEV